MSDRDVTFDLSTPRVDELGQVVHALRSWQDDAAPLQLHPGDLGWAWQFGADALAAGLRTWSRDGEIMAIGMLDSPDVLRLTTAPDARQDETLARQLVADLSTPERGVLPAGQALVEAPNGTRVQQALTDTGWDLDEPWTPLRRDLSAPVADPGVRTEVMGPEQASTFTTIHRSSFGSTRFTDDLWHTMAAGKPYGDGRSLLAYDDQGVAVAVVTVWSAGPGRPGLLEPMGVHADHHGHGYGRAITVAACSALRDMGASSALVCTPSTRIAAVATYRSAGFGPLPERFDRSRAV